jgi:nucleoside-diphosphate-sugar epimerase
MRVLVIGGTKFIGLAAAERLHGMGHDVTVFHRGQTESITLPDVAHLHGDRQGLADFTADFKRLALDVVLDTIAYTERDAQTVMATFAGIARRIIALSSMDVYRAYGRVKGSEPGRTIMADPALPGTILRLPAVYGPHDHQHRLWPYLKRMEDRRPAILLDEQIARWRWTRGYVDNVAIAIALAVTDERAIGRVYNVGEEQALTEADWVRAIGRAAGWDGEVVPGNAPTRPPTSRQRCSTTPPEDLITVAPCLHLPVSMRWWWSCTSGHRRRGLGPSPRDAGIGRTPVLSPWTSPRARGGGVLTPRRMMLERGAQSCRQQRHSLFSIPISLIHHRP